MTVRASGVATVASWADRAWCRLVRSSAGEQVLRAYGDRQGLAGHLAHCGGCRKVADGYATLAWELHDLPSRSFAPPPDFVDRVIAQLSAPLDPIRRRRSTREKAALAAAAVLSATAVGLAAAARRRRAAI